MKSDDDFVSGFAAVIGFPNVGKSTLVNQLVGHKVAIVSRRPQTTRNRIRGIANTEDAQIIFVDTPGIQKPRDRLEEHMVRAARRTVDDVDVVLFVVDGSRPQPGQGDLNCASIVNRSDTPAVLVVNKLDLVDRKERDARIDTYRDLGEFDAVVATSALHGGGIDILRWELMKLLPRGGPRYYPSDVTTDQPTSFLVAELIREKVLELTEQEVPYSTAVQVVQIEDRGDSNFYIAADILVERHSQRGILIGRGGRMIRTIGERSRREVEKLLDISIYLDLHVRVQKNWRENFSILDELGVRVDRE